MLKSSGVQGSFRQPQLYIPLTIYSHWRLSEPTSLTDEENDLFRNETSDLDSGKSYGTCIVCHSALPLVAYSQELICRFL